jgi:hypothetical protein
MSWWVQIMASDAYNNKLVVVLSRDHFTVVAKPGFPVGTAFSLMCQGVDDRPEAYVDVKVRAAASHHALPILYSSGVFCMHAFLRTHALCRSLWLCVVVDRRWWLPSRPATQVRLTFHDPSQPQSKPLFLTALHQFLLPLC